MHVCACCVVFYIYHERRSPWEQHYVSRYLLFHWRYCAFVWKQPVEIDLWYTAYMVCNMESDSVIKKKTVTLVIQAFLERYTISFPPCPPWSPSFYCKLSWAECWIRPLFLSSNADPMTPVRLLNFCAGRWPLGSFRDRMSHIIYVYTLVRLKNIGVQP